MVVLSPDEGCIYGGGGGGYEWGFMKGLDLKFVVKMCFFRRYVMTSG